MFSHALVVTVLSGALIVVEVVEVVEVVVVVVVLVVVEVVAGSSCT